MPVRVGPTSLLLLCFLTGVLQKWSDGLAVDLKTVPRDSALESFFGSIDKDGDGQIEPSEARQYIDANFDRSDINLDASKAAQQMSKNLDGSDSDATISKDEVEGHLRRLLKVHHHSKQCNYLDSPGSDLVLCRPLNNIRLAAKFSLLPEQVHQAHSHLFPMCGSWYMGVET